MPLETARGAMDLVAKLKDMNEDGYVRIFSYGLGSGATGTSPPAGRPCTASGTAVFSSRIPAPVRSPGTRPRRALAYGTSTEHEQRPRRSVICVYRASPVWLR